MKKHFFFPWPAFFVVALITGLIYSNIYHCPFVFDAKTGIIDKPELRDLSYYTSVKNLLAPKAIVDLTFALNYRFGKLNVIGYHVINVLIHIFNSCLVYLLAAFIFNKKLSNTAQPSRNVMALFTALIYAAHPLQTQAVTYTIQRFASVAAFFYMASVFFYLKARTTSQYERRPKPKGKKAKRKKPIKTKLFPNSILFIILSVLCGLLAFLSKQNTASLPGVILLVEYVFFTRNWADWKKMIPKFAAMMILWTLFATLVIWFSGQAGETGNLLEDVSGLMRETEEVSRGSYLCTQFNVLVIYLRLLVLPILQNLDYLYPMKAGFFDGLTPLAFLLLTSIAFLGIRCRDKHPVISLAVGWFFITLSVESSFIPISDALFEHRLYLPLFSLALAMPYLIFHCFSGKTRWSIPVCVLIVILLGTAAYTRNYVYHSKMSLWRDVVTKNPQNHRAHNNLGITLNDAGEHGEATGHFLEALKLKPDYADAHTNLGNALLSQGNQPAAIEKLEKAIELNPNIASPYNNLGYIHLKAGKAEKALTLFKKAITIKPFYPEAHINLAKALLDLGQRDEALAAYKNALKIIPDHPTLFNNLANIYTSMGAPEKAIPLYKKTLEVDPSYAKAYNNLATIYYNQGRPEDAIAAFEKALFIDPGDANSYFNLGNALNAQGKKQEAIKIFRKAIETDPTNARFHSNLGGVLADLGQSAAAITSYTKAIKLAPRDAALHTNLGNTLFSAGKPEEALASFKKALELDPDHAATHYNVAVIYFYSKQYTPAAKHYRRAHKLGFDIPVEFQKLIGPYLK